MYSSHGFNATPRPNSGEKVDSHPQLSLLDRPLRFDGTVYDPAHDRARLTGQIKRVFGVLADHAWHTVAEVARLTGDPEPSISAQIRNLRKPRFGGHTVERRARGDRSMGLFEFRLVAR